MERHLERYWSGSAWTDEVVDLDPEPVPSSSAPPMTSPGWNADPTGRFRLRYHNGTAWTARVSFSEATPDGLSRPAAPAPIASVPSDAQPSAREEREVVGDFLRDAVASGDLDTTTYQRLYQRLLKQTFATRQRAVAPRVTEPSVVLPGAMPGATPTTRGPSLPPTAPPPSAPPTAPPPPAGPPEWSDLARRWAGRWLGAVRSDLAVHGLAYLGVLLLFAGVFGFVAFAFGDVSQDLRPLAEVLIPAAIFLSAWVLSRRGAPSVAAALELLGAAVLPLVVIAAFVDASGIPPDVTGGALEITLAGALFALAVLYALVTIRWPSTMMRFLAAPVAWLAVLMGALVTDPRFRGGDQVTRPAVWQTAIALAAIFVTATVAQRFRGRALADGTSAGVLPGVVVVLALQVIASARSDWPVGPSILAGIATIAILEIEHARLGDDATAVLQSLAGVATLWMLVPRVDDGWIGAAGVVGAIALTEWTAWRRPSTRTLRVMPLLVVLGLLISWPQPWAVVVAFTSASVWVHVRRVLRPAWAPSPEAVDVVASVVPVGIACGLVGALGLPEGSLSVAAVLLGVAAAVRIVHAVRDPFWSSRLFGAAMSTLPLVGVAAVDSRAVRADLWWCAAAAGAVAAVFLLSPGRSDRRVWGTAAGIGLAASLGFTAASADVGLAAAAFASAGLACVLIALDRRRAIAGDLGLVGHVVAVGSLVPGSVAGGWVAALVWGACAAGWTVTTVAQEMSDSAVADRLSRYATGRSGGQPGSVVVDAAAVPTRRGAIAAGLPVFAALVTSAVFVPLLITEAGWIEPDSGWVSAVIAGIALVDAAISRVFAHRVRVSRVASWFAFALALLAAASDRNDVGVVTATLGVLTIATIPQPRRRLVMESAAWLLSGAAVVRGAIVFGLERNDLQVVLFPWGAMVAAAGLWRDRREAGTRRRWIVVRNPRWLVPVVAGALGVGVAMIRAYSEGPGSFGWWTLAASIVFLGWAVAANAPEVSLIAAGFGVDACARLLPWPLPEQAWNLAIAVGLLSVLALVLRPRSHGCTWRARWDLWPFVAANGAACTMIAAAEQTSSPAATYLTVGGWAIAVAVVTRWWPWLVAGVVLVEVGAGRAGSGWLTLALGLTAVAATYGASRRRPPARTILQVTGASALAGAVATGMWWQDVGAATAARVGAVVAGAVVLAAAGGLRRRRLGRDWVLVWSGVSIVALAAAGAVAAAVGSRSATAGVGVGVLLVAAATAMVAAPLGQPVLRGVAVILLAGGTALLLVAASASLAVATATACSIGLVALVAAASLDYRRSGSPWVIPLVGLAALAAGGSIAIGVVGLPDRSLLVPALALAGGEAAVFGIAARRPMVTALAPVLLCASWLTYATDALQGNPEWMTVPIGLTLLVVGGLLRASEEARSPASRSRVVRITLDYAGMAFVVGAALVQTVTTSLWYGLLAVGLGVVLTGWGVVSRVRRRAWFGVGTVAGAAILLVGVPIAARAFPERGETAFARGPVLWVVIAAIGLLAVMVAAFLEQGRRRVRAALRQLSEFTRDWE